MELNKDIPKELLDKLQKLLALEARPGSVGEAAAAAHMISKLLMRYNLSRQNVQDKVTEQENAIHRKEGCFDNFQTQYDGDFAKQLLAHIAFFNFCQMLYIAAPKDKGKGSFILLGKKHNVEIAYYLFDYCINNLTRLFDEHWEKNKKHITEKKNIHKRNFYKGAVFALAARFEEMREVKNDRPANDSKQPKRPFPSSMDDPIEEDIDKEEEMSEDEERELNDMAELEGSLTLRDSESNQLALVIAENNSAIDEEIKRMAEEEGSEIKTDKRGMKIGRDVDALKAGVVAGKELPLNAGVKGSAKKQQGQLTSAPLQIGYYK